MRMQAMQEEEFSELRHELYARVHEEMLPLVQRHTVSIIAYYHGRPRQHATGTLVRFSDHWFVVTAGHAIRDYDDGKRHYADLGLFQ